jgi:hypothetical protein
MPPWAARSSGCSAADVGGEMHLSPKDLMRCLYDEPRVGAATQDWRAT